MIQNGKTSLQRNACLHPTLVLWQQHDLKEVQKALFWSFEFQKRPCNVYPLEIPFKCQMLHSMHGAQQCKRGGAGGRFGGHFVWTETVLYVHRKVLTLFGGQMVLEIG